MAKMKKRRWTKEQITQSIREHVQQGLSISSRDIRRANLRLYWAGINRFETWERAVEESGFLYESVRKGPVPEHWNKELVIQRIRERVQNSLPISSEAVRRQDSRLYKAGHRYFRTWESVVEASGFSYVAVRKGPVPESYWTKELVIQRIRERVSQGLSISHNNVRREDSTLYDAARTRFKKWGFAVEESGFLYESVRKGPASPVQYWTKELVIKCIRERVSQGFSISLKDVRTEDRPLFYAGRTHFSNRWRFAVEAAGFSYRSVCRVYRSDDLPRSSLTENRVALYRELGSRKKSVEGKIRKKHKDRER